MQKEKLKSEEILFILDTKEIIIKQNSLTLWLIINNTDKKIEDHGIWLTRVNTKSVAKSLSELINEKLKEPESSSQIKIYTERNVFLKSLNIRNLLKNYNIHFEDASFNYSEIIKKIDFYIDNEVSISNFQEDKTLDIGTVSTIIQTSIKNWNTNLNQILLEIESTNSYNETDKKNKVMLQVQSLETRYAELVSMTPFDKLIRDEESEIESCRKDLATLKELIIKNNVNVEKLVNLHSAQLNERFNNIESTINTINGNVEKLLPNEKQKSNPVPLRDPITEEIFNVLLFNAGSLAVNKKNVRQAQLKIAYTLLYYLGLRLNELRTLKLTGIEDGIRRSELRVILHKSNRPHNYTLSKAAITKLKSLDSEFRLLKDVHKRTYLFGKTYPLHPKALLKIVNDDLANTCQLCDISDNISSHSFRISVISRLLRVSQVHDVAEIMGHQDIRTTMTYNRYRLPKSEIQKIYAKGEQVSDFRKSSDL